MCVCARVRSCVRSCVRQLGNQPLPCVYVCVRVRVSAWQPATAARRLQSPARVAVAVHGHVRLVRAVREA